MTNAKAALAATIALATIVLGMSLEGHYDRDTIAPTKTELVTPVKVPGPTVTKTIAPTPTIEEDDPRWNCMTMGNRICGPDWEPVKPELGDALSEGSDKPFTFRWEDCKVKWENEDGTAYSDATIVVCPDGDVIIS